MSRTEPDGQRGDVSLCGWVGGEEVDRLNQTLNVGKEELGNLGNPHRRRSMTREARPVWWGRVVSLCLGFSRERSENL